MVYLYLPALGSLYDNFQVDFSEFPFSKNSGAFTLIPLDSPFMYISTIMSLDSNGFSNGTFKST